MHRWKSIVLASKPRVNMCVKGGIIIEAKQTCIILALWYLLQSHMIKYYG